MDNFLLLSCGVLASDGLATRSALRMREDKITGLLDLSEHIDSVPLSLELCLRGRRTQVDVLVLQRHRVYLVMRHVLLRWLGLEGHGFLLQAARGAHIVAASGIDC